MENLIFGAVLLTQSIQENIQAKWKFWFSNFLYKQKQPAGSFFSWQMFFHEIYVIYLKIQCNRFAN